MIDDSTLDKILGSPDPTVRKIAFEYKELMQKVKDTAAFIAVYTSAMAEMKTVPVALRKRPQMAASRMTTAGEFVSQVHEVLLEHREPMAIKDLYTAYYERWQEEEKKNYDAFRQGLFKQRSKGFLTFTDNERYWLPPEMLPAVEQESDVAA